ncbi:hypothetical protein M5E87_09825 [Flavonifractor plautii]|nr:hypothetical protein M5E87_09825 [Flavonifractor plautii]
MPGGVSHPAGEAPAPGKERPWLARVAVNRCRDLLTSPGAGGGRTTTRPWSG